MIDIVFDGPAAHEAPSFVEVEDADGVSIRLGSWVERVDGSWAIRITRRELIDILNGEAVDPLAQDAHRYSHLIPVGKLDAEEPFCCRDDTVHF